MQLVFTSADVKFRVRYNYNKLHVRVGADRTVIDLRANTGSQTRDVFGCVECLLIARCNILEHLIHHCFTYLISHKLYSTNQNTVLQ